MRSRAFWSMVAVCAFLPAARAQPDPGAKPGFGFHGYPYGPRVAPPWGYPLLNGGPSVGYAGAPGGETVGVLGAFGPNGPHLCRPRVPVYEPVPQVVPNTRLVRQWQTAAFPGAAGYGWFGIYNASPRPRGLSVSVWPTGGPSVGGAGSVNQTGTGGACLVLSVRVPQSAEVLVDGNPTAQTGTDRTFESPPLGAGQSYQYTVTARWVEGGQTVEVSKAVAGAPGEVVRVDFGAPAAAGK